MKKSDERLFEGEAKLTKLAEGVRGDEEGRNKRGGAKTKREQ